ncbi:MAG: class I SAM-dependent DNA methyltransferase [Thermomicrobiales bacterium]
MDIAQFDRRNYPTRSVQEGYGEWAATYENVVLDALDLRLLARIRSVVWSQARAVADLACGTGRIGAWLTRHGASAVDGIDVTPGMLDGARAKGVYRHLVLGDIRRTPFRACAYDLVTAALVDEHLPDVRPLYQEAARIARAAGRFVLVGYHPFFLMGGIPTHFNSASAGPVTIECYVHLLSDHVYAALAAGWSLREMHEGLIDDEWLAKKPKWSNYRHQPVSFAMVWQKQ